MTLILDVGALVGIDQRDRRVAGLLEIGQRTGSALVTSASPPKPNPRQATSNEVEDPDQVRELPPRPSPNRIS